MSNYLEDLYNLCDLYSKDELINNRKFFDDITLFFYDVSSDINKAYMVKTYFQRGIYLGLETWTLSYKRKMAISYENGIEISPHIIYNFLSINTLEYFKDDGTIINCISVKVNI